MYIGILGSGQVAQTIGAKLLEKRHSVMLSSRNIDAVKDKGQWGKLQSAREWKDEQEKKGYDAYVSDFQEAAAHGELIFNCTAGAGSLEAIKSAGEENFSGKILIDLANPLDFSKGMPPTLSVSNTTSLGEQIQAALPGTKVVKTLNTVSAMIMVKPGLVRGKHDLFMAGNDETSKEWVKKNVLMGWFGWKSIIDLGDISSARGTEMYLPLWLRLMGALNTSNFNIKVVKGST